MNYERRNDHLDKKITDFNLKLFDLIFGVLYKPLGTATEPFFRKNLGARYFTMTSAIFGVMLWMFAASLGKIFSSSAPESFSGVGALAKFGAPDFLGGIVAGVFFVLATVNIAASWVQQNEGINWHSLSRGQCLWGIESPWLDAGISIVAGALLLKFTPITGLLFVASRIISWSMVHKERRSIYARYLDVMDAKIEAEHLEVALRDGAPPKLTEGLYGPLPKRIKGQHRATVARIVAGGHPDSSPEWCNTP